MVFVFYFFLFLKHELRDLIDSLNVWLMVVVLYVFFLKMLTQTATAATKQY